MQFQKGDPPGDQAGKEIRLDLDTNVFIFPSDNLPKLISFDRSLATAAPWKQKWILSDGFFIESRNPQARHQSYLPTRNHHP